MRLVRPVLPGLAGLVVLFTLVAGAIHANGRLIDDAERMRFDDRTSLVRNRAGGVLMGLEKGEQFIRQMADAPWELVAASAADKQAVDRLVSAYFGVVHSIALLDDSGKMLTQSGDGSKVPSADDAGFADARRRLDAGLPGATQVMRLPDGVPTQGVAADIPDASGARRGTIVVFTVLTGANAFQPFAEASSMAGDDESPPSFYVYDANLVVVGGPTDADIGTQLPEPAFRRTASGVAGNAEVVLDGRRHVVVYEPVGTMGYTIAFVQEAAAFYGDIRAHRRNGDILFFVAVGLLGLIVVGLWTRKHQLARRQEEKLASLLAHAADAVLVVRGDTVTYSSPAVERLTGRTCEDLAGGSFRAMLQEDDDRRRFDTAVAEAAAAPGRAVTVELGVTAPGARPGWADGTVVDLSHDARIGGLVVTLHDITERKTLEAEVRHRSLHDTLTGLANRTLFQDRLELAAKRAKRHPTSAALLFLDLDRFKPVNDELGHHAGDIVLTAVAERLRAGIRSHDTAARLGGDEFGVLLENVEAWAEVEVLAHRLLASLAQPIDVEGTLVSIGASIGIACVAPGEQFDTESLMRNADLAMYVAKDAPDRSIVVYGAEQAELGRAAD